MVMHRFYCSNPNDVALVHCYTVTVIPVRATLLEVHHRGPPDITFALREDAGKSLDF